MPLSLVTCEFIESLAMSASDRHSDSHFLLGLSARARGRDSGKGACERVYKRSVGWVPIDAGYSSVKIYSFMFSGSKDLYNEHLGASSAQPRSKLERQVGAAIEMETIAGRLRTSGHVYMDDMFALYAVRPYPCVSLCVSPCVCVCVAVFECLSWHENSQARPCRMCDSAHIDTQLHTHISLSMAVVNMTVIRTTQMLRMFAVLAKTCLAGATGALPERTFIKLEPGTIEAKAKFPSILFVLLF